jgi:hypothetical protein
MYCTVLDSHQRILFVKNKKQRSVLRGSLVNLPVHSVMYTRKTGGGGAKFYMKDTSFLFTSAGKHKECFNNLKIIFKLTMFFNVIELKYMYKNPVS